MTSCPAPSQARTTGPLRPTAPPLTLRLGTRGSALARAQSQQVADALSRATGHRVDLVTITTFGDTSPRQLAQIGGTGVFCSALRDALLEGEVDFVVHSLKDLPTAAPDALALAAVPPREDPRDALVSRDGLGLKALARDCASRPVRIGTGSPRRTAQLHAWAGELGVDLETVPIRGNVDTRIGFVREGRLDAVVLAAAGLNRLGRRADAAQLLDPEVMLPAPGQGALAIECRSGDAPLRRALSVLDDPRTRAAVTAERALLAALEAGCSAPVGALARWRRRAGSGDLPGRPAGELQLRAVVGAADGAPALHAEIGGVLPADRAAQAGARALGTELAERLLAAGAGEWVRTPVAGAGRGH